MSENGIHRFSWDGVSFCVPTDWNLATYNDFGKVTSVRLDDDVSVRLNAEWVRTAGRPDMYRTLKRYEKMSADLKAGAAETHDLSAIHPGWGAFLYTMSDKRRLLVAFKPAGENNVFCFFRVHFGPGGRTAVAEFAKTLMSSFVVYDSGLVPWECYDMSLRIPREFKLHSSSLIAGRKVMVFNWKRRRLHVVFASLADMILKKSEMANWVADFLAKYKDIQGPVFTVSGNRVVAERRRFPPLIHFDEIFRMCFRYAVTCRHDAERNMLILSVFNYRKDPDLKLLEGTDFMPQVIGDSN